MKDDNVLPAELCLLIAEDSLYSELSKVLSDAYLLKHCSALDALSPDLIPPPKLMICQFSLLQDDIENKIQQLKSCYSKAHVLLIGPAAPVPVQISVLKYGARGYFNLDMPLVKLNEAVQLLLHGEVWIERQVISGLIDELTQVPSLTDEQQTALDSLTPKELEVAKLVSHGATNKMIARTMDITERTVKAHLTTIFQKMNLADRLSLAIFFRDIR